MSESGEIYTAKKFYTAASSYGIDKFHLCRLVFDLQRKNQT